MGKEIIMFGDIEIEKRKFYHRKNLILLNDVDIEKMQVSGTAYSGEKIVNILLVINMMIIQLNHYA